MGPRIQYLNLTLLPGSWKKVQNMLGEIYREKTRARDGEQYFIYFCCSVECVRQQF